MRLTLLSTIGWGVIVSSAVVAVWVPSIIISMNALVDAREDQLLGVTQSMHDQIIEVFQVASRASRLFAYYYHAALDAAPNNATQYYHKHFAVPSWYHLQNNPTIIGMWVAYLRKDIVGNSTCDIDTSIIATGLVANINEDTSGPKVSNCNKTSGQAACNGGFRINRPAGPLNPSNPVEPMQLAAPDRPCHVGVASRKRLWSPVQPDQNETFHGYYEPTWGTDLRIVGNSSAIIMRMVHPLPGPAWAPLSGLCGVTLRISNRDFSDSPGSRSLGDILRRAAKKTELKDILFILSAHGYLIASSMNITLDMLDPSGRLISMPLASNRSHLPPTLTDVSVYLLDNHCVRAGDAYNCDWGNVAELQSINGYTVVAAPLNDPLAKGLGMLLVTMARSSDVRAPAWELNINLAIIAPIVLVASCIVAFVFSYTVSKPILTFCLFLQDAAEMRDLHEISQESQKTSFITEITSMRVALGQLVHALVEYKSYLPPNMFLDEVMDKEDNTPFYPVVQNTKGSESQSQQSQLTNTTVVTSGSGHRTSRQLCRRKSAIMAINLCMWTKHVGGLRSDAIANEMCRYVSLIRDSLYRKAAIDHFNGDRLLVSWNTGSASPGYRRRACEAAHAIRIGTVENQWLKCPMGIGISGGTVLSGNAGSDALRSFNIIGVPVTHAISLSEVASASASRVVVLASENIVEVGHHFVMPVTGILHCSKLERQGLSYRKVFHEVLDPIQGNDEWLYTIGEQSIGNLIDLFARVVQNPQAIGDLKKELLPLMLRIRQSMIFADTGWTEHIQTLSDDDQALFHTK